MDFSLLGFQSLHELFNLHPAFVHFPIVLFPTSFLFYVVGAFTGKPGLKKAGQILLGLAVVSTVVAIISGRLAAASIPHNETIHHMMETHERMAYLIVGVGGLLFLWSFWGRESQPRGGIFFLILLGVATLLVFMNADLGARMVYVQGAAVKPLAPTMEEEGHEHYHDHHHGTEEGDHHDEHPH